MAIYLVQTQQGDTLVDAKSKAQAIGHIIKPLVTAKAVSAGEVVALMQKGVKVETAIEEAASQRQAPRQRPSRRSGWQSARPR